MMKLGNIKSAELLPRFAHAIAWVMDALDRAVKYINGRANSIDAPLTLESIQALTDNELEALYKELGVAEYYPDLTRETRDRFLFELARAYRYLGTPHAVELLCQYIFDDTPIEVEVDDNRAWDSSGHLVDEDLLDTFSVQVTPDSLDATPEQHARILANIIRFSRNSQALESIYYNFESSFDLPVYPVALGRACAETTYGESPCVPIPGMVIGGTVGLESLVGEDFEIDPPVSLRGGIIDLSGNLQAESASPHGVVEGGNIDLTGNLRSDNRVLEMVFGARWYVENPSWLSVQFGANDYWWSGILDNADKAKLEAFGLSVNTTATDPFAGTIGAVQYNGNFIFEVTALYSGIGEGSLSFDPSNFRCEEHTGTNYDGALVIANTDAYAQSIKSWGCRITKKLSGSIISDPYAIIAYKADGTTSPGIFNPAGGTYQVDAVDSSFHTAADLEALGWYVKWRVYSKTSSNGINIRDSYGTSGTTVISVWYSGDPVVNPNLHGPEGYENWMQAKFSTDNGATIQNGWINMGVTGYGISYVEQAVNKDYFLV